jgi:PAS domain S-box-containing protein
MPLSEAQLRSLHEYSLDEVAYQRLIDLVESVASAQPRSDEKSAELEHFFAVSLDLWCIADTDGYFLKLSPMWETTLGYALEELTGQRFLDFVHPDDIQATIAATSALVAQQPVLDFTNRYRCKDGSYRFIEWRSRSEGKLIYAAARDVTERQQLEAYQSRLVAIIESSSNAIIGETLNGIITDWNPAAETMYGYTAAEMIGQSIALIIPPDLLHELVPLLAAIGHGLVVQHHETVRLRKDGSRIDVALTVSPIKDKNGIILGASVIAQDITELKQARDALQESETRLRSIFETMDDAVWSVELPGYQMIYLNPAGSRILGRSREEMDQHHELRLELIHPDDVALAQAALQTTLTAGRAEVEYRMVRPDGEIRWALSRSRLVRDSRGQPVRLEGLISDITDRKLAQRQAVELEIQRERVRLLGEFIANTSHELRTPLTIIASNVYLMARLDDPLQREVKAANVEQQIRYLTMMIDELHQMVVLDQLGALETVPVQLGHLAQSLVADYIPKKSGVTVICDSASDTPEIRGDPRNLSLAIFHLLDNAVRFSPKEGQVMVRTALQGGEAVLEVEDRGIGIAQEHLDHIFEHFYKVNTARTRSDDGMGMGLALVRRIMELHQGRVTVRSELGQGTVFTLHFAPLPS